MATRTVHSFSVRETTLEKLRRVSKEAGIAGGMSAIVEDATSAWLRRYESDPKLWLLTRGLAATSEPENDDL